MAGTEMDIEKLSSVLEELKASREEQQQQQQQKDDDEAACASPLAAGGRSFDRRVSVPFANYDPAMLSPDADAAHPPQLRSWNGNGGGGLNSAESSRRSSSQSEGVLTPEEEARCRSNLYVSLLGEDVTDGEIRNLFEPFGPIDSAVVMRNIHTGRSRGIAFVQFCDEDSAKKALEAASNMVIRGRAISVQVASRKAMYTPGAATNRLFIRNVPADVGETALMKHFSQYGDVVKVTLHNDSAKAQAMYPNDSAVLPSAPTNVPPPRIAFVTFQTVDHARKAASAIHNSVPFASCFGVPLLAKVAEDGAKRQERISRSQSLSSTPTSQEVSLRESSEIGCHGQPHGMPVDRPLGIMLRTMRTPSSDLGSPEGPAGSSPTGIAAAAASSTAPTGLTPLSTSSSPVVVPPLPVAEDGPTLIVEPAAASSEPRAAALPVAEAGAPSSPLAAIGSPIGGGAMPQEGRASPVAWAPAAASPPAAGIRLPLLHPMVAPGAAFGQPAPAAAGPTCAAPGAAYVIGTHLPQRLPSAGFGTYPHTQQQHPSYAPYGSGPPPATWGSGPMPLQIPGWPMPPPPQFYPMAGAAPGGGSSSSSGVYVVGPSPYGMVANPGPFAPYFPPGPPQQQQQSQFFQQQPYQQQQQQQQQFQYPLPPGGFPYVGSNPVAAGGGGVYQGVQPGGPVPAPAAPAGAAQYYGQPSGMQQQQPPQPFFMHPFPQQMAAQHHQQQQQQQQPPYQHFPHGAPGVTVRLGAQPAVYGGAANQQQQLQRQ